MTETAPVYWTEPEVYRRLARVFPPPAHVLLSQVRNGVGYAKRTRTADALVASVWPSRGLYLTGVEIKVSRGDWLRELKKPEKSVSIQAYCRHWYIATPPGIVEPGTLPETWGLIETTEGRTRIVTPAPKLDPKPVDMLFVCSILRAISEQTVPSSEVEQRIRERVETEKLHQAQRQQQEVKRLRERIERFEEASGVKIDEYQEGQIGAAVAMVREAKGSDMLFALRALAHNAEQVAKLAKDAIRLGAVFQEGKEGEGGGS